MFYLSKSMAVLLTCRYCRLCEASIGLICSCMPVITVALKTFVTGTASSWNYVKKYSQTLFSRTERFKNPKAGEDKLPEIPQGNISGLRTFIHRFQRSNTNSIPLRELSTFATLNSDVDRDYHGQLRDMHDVDIERLVTAAPASQGHIK